MPSSLWTSILLYIFIVVSLSISLLSSHVHSWPVTIGETARLYSKRDFLDLSVGKLSSEKTLLPYHYYALPFCQPTHIKYAKSNFGEALLGSQLARSHRLKIGEQQSCLTLCVKNYSRSEANQFIDKIRSGYKANWFLDGLPAVLGSDLTREYVGDNIGFPLGEEIGENVVLFNHHDIKIYYNPVGTELSIVAFKVNPSSKNYPLNFLSSFNEDQKNSAPRECLEKNVPPLKLSDVDHKTVVWTYSVKWVLSLHTWEERWSYYLQGNDEDDKIHWLSVINSIIIILFLTAMVVMILIRTLRNDLKKYADEKNFEDEESPSACPIPQEHTLSSLKELTEEPDETGWKLIHGDVFRTPHHYDVLSSFIGTGVQSLMCVFVVIAFSSTGLLSPAIKGAFVIIVVVTFPLMGVFGGYVAGRMYRMFGGQSFRRIWVMSALLIPGLIFLHFFITCIIHWVKETSAATSLVVFSEVFVIWFGISIILNGVGVWFAFKAAPIEHPLKVNPLPRSIPDKPWYMSSALMTLVGGVLPLGVIFVETYFVVSAIWLQRFYFVFGFLLLIFVLFLIATAEVAIVMCYLQLSREDHRWMWQSFFTTGSSSLYFQLYSLCYLFSRLSIRYMSSALLVLNYIMIMGCVFFVLSGAVGFLSCFLFVRKIYSSIKID